MTEKDAVEVMKRNRKLVCDGNVVMDNAKAEAETLIAKSKALIAEPAHGSWGSEETESPPPSAGILVQVM